MYTVIYWDLNTAQYMYTRRTGWKGITHSPDPVKASWFGRVCDLKNSKVYKIVKSRYPDAIIIKVNMAEAWKEIYYQK